MILVHAHVVLVIVVPLPLPRHQSIKMFMHVARAHENTTVWCCDLRGVCTLRAYDAFSICCNAISIRTSYVHVVSKLTFTFTFTFT